MTWWWMLAGLSAQAEELELRNDGFESGDQAAFQQGFAGGECWGSVFLTDEHAPLTLSYVDMLVGTSDIYEVSIWQAEEILKTPFTRLGGEAVNLTGSTSDWNRVTLAELKLSGSVLRVESGNIAIVVCVPSEWGSLSLNSAIARDTDGTVTDNLNWIRTTSGSWYQAADLGVAGDWIMRLVVETDGSTGGGEDSGSEQGDSGWEGGEDSDPGAGGQDSDPDPGGDPEDEEESAALELSQIIPAESIEGDGSEVAVLGAGFDESCEARIGGLPLTGQTLSGDSSLSGKVSTALPAGTHDVEVVRGDGERALLSAAFVVHPAEEEEASSEEEEDSKGCRHSPGGLLLSAWPLGLCWLRRRRAR